MRTHPCTPICTHTHTHRHTHTHTHTHAHPCTQCHSLAHTLSVFICCVGPGADVEAADARTGVTLLHRAVLEGGGSPNMVQFLLQACPTFLPCMSVGACVCVYVCVSSCMSVCVTVCVVVRQGWVRLSLTRSFSLSLAHTRTHSLTGSV
jgi:hypothetical protein